MEKEEHFPERIEEVEELTFTQLLEQVRNTPVPKEWLNEAKKYSKKTNIG